MRLLDDEIDLRTLSPLTLAFIGDAVYDLLVREMLVCRGNRPVGVMNNEKIELVRCETQARYAKALFDSLTEEEQSVLKRGKNANAMTVPKHASRIDYHFATGFVLSSLVLLAAEKALKESRFSRHHILLGVSVAILSAYSYYFA